jgi:hypothetical protein
MNTVNIQRVKQNKNILTDAKRKTIYQWNEAASLMKPRSR